MPGAVFHKGEFVSCGKVTGKVIELKRRSDGKPFLMIQILDGPRRGERSWPSEGWTLGIGPHEAVCSSCNRRFKFHTGEDAFFCTRCGGEDVREAHQRSQDPERPRSSWERKQLRDRARGPVETT